MTWVLIAVIVVLCLIVVGLLVLLYRIADSLWM